MKTTIVAIAKRENKYIREWVEYYLKLGFDNIVLYDNNDKDDELLSDVIDDYIDSGFIIYDTTFIDKDFSQIQAYDHFLNIYSKNFDYAFICDIDEYITLSSKYNNIKDLLYEYNNIYSLYHMICLFWVTYGDNGYIEKSSFNTLTCYDNINNIIDNSKFYNIYHKPIINCNKCNIDFIDGVSKYFNDAHHINNEYNIKYCDTDGNKINCTNCYIQPNYDNIYIKHFITRSLEDFYNVKLSRQLFWFWDAKIELYYSVNNKIKEYENYLNYINPGIENKNKKIYFIILYNNDEYDLIKYNKLKETYLSKINNVEYNKYLYSEYFNDFYNIFINIKDKYDIIVCIDVNYYINYEIFNKFIYIIDEDICYVDIIQERSPDIYSINQINEKCFIISNKILNIILDSELIKNNNDSLYWYPYYTTSIILSENNINIKQLGYLDQQFNYAFNLTTEYNMIYKYNFNQLDKLHNFILDNENKFILKLSKNNYIHIGFYDNTLKNNEYNNNISYKK